MIAGSGVRTRSESTLRNRRLAINLMARHATSHGRRKLQAAERFKQRAVGRARLVLMRQR